jgi:hypothetical protein
MKYHHHPYKIIGTSTDHLAIFFTINQIYAMCIKDCTQFFQGGKNSFSAIEMTGNG